MKSLGGLKWALKSTRPRYAPIYTIPRARVTLVRETSGQAVGGFPVRFTHRRTQGGRVESSKPSRHVLSQPMRAVMRQIPHPVVVITTLENAGGPDKLDDTSNVRDARPIPRAMTVSSFTSLSIDPVPRVTFNVTLPSTTHQALVKCRRFNAHILSSDDHGARIADLFTRGNRPPETEGIAETDLGVLAGLEKLGIQVLGRQEWKDEWEQARNYKEKPLATDKNTMSRSEVEAPSSGTLPVLQGRGIMHVLKCEYRHLEPPVDGDFDHHAIVIGEVLDIIPGESRDENSLALAYADRAYRQMGEKLLDRPTTDQDTSTERTTQHVNIPKNNSGIREES